MAWLSLPQVFQYLRKEYPALEKRVREAEAVQRWEIAVGPQIAKHAKAIRVKDSVLWVAVDHPIWKSELHHRKCQILEILNANIEAARKAQPAPEAPIQDLLLLDLRPGQSWS